MSCGPCASFNDKGQEEACFLIEALASYSQYNDSRSRYFMGMSRETLSLYLPKW